MKIVVLDEHEAYFNLVLLTDEELSAIKSCLEIAVDDSPHHISRIILPIIEKLNEGSGNESA